MNAQEAILKIKGLFEENLAAPPAGEPTPEVETKVEMKEYDLADGTKVEISALEIGGECKYADGTTVPMGEYTLADGTNVQLDENGIIVEISTPEEDAMPEEAPAEEVPADMGKELDKKMQGYSEQFEAQVAELKAQKEASDKKVAELEAKVKQGFAQVAELVEALTKTPNADPIQKPNGFSDFVSTNDIKEQRIARFRNAILNTKN
jgi:hypothetical protein